MITARLLVKSHRNGMVDKDGKSAAITLGIVSPMMTQKATMPPKANAHWAMDIAMSPEEPKQCSTVPWKEFAPLSFELTTIKRIVQSTVIVKITRRRIPADKPACRKAYG